MSGLNQSPINVAAAGFASLMEVQLRDSWLCQQARRVKKEDSIFLRTGCAKTKSLCYNRWDHITIPRQLDATKA